MEKIILGVIGPICSGKGTVIKILEKYGFASFSTSDRIREYLRANNLEVTRENLHNYANELREKFGHEVLVKRSMDLAQKERCEKVIIDAMRHPDEVKYLKDKYGAKVLGINATPEKRFELMLIRGRDGDPKTWEEFRRYDQAEAGHKSEHGQQVKEALALADLIIENNGILEDLEKEVKGKVVPWLISPDPLKDQFFLIDDKILNQIIDFSDLKDSDVVLEIGVGTGNLTRKLVPKVKKVLAFEIDEKFKPFLADLPDNVKLNFEDVHPFFDLKGKFTHSKEFNKVVSNLPYSLCEPLLHNLTFLECDKVVLLVPEKFAKSAKTSPVFSSFFQIEVKLKVPRSSFYPVPKTNSVVIDLKKLPDPVKTKDRTLFLRQYLYQHEEQKAGNALREGLVKYTWLVKKKRPTKNQARKIIEDSGIDKALLERQPDNPEIYEQVSGKIHS